MHDARAQQARFNRCVQLLLAAADAVEEVVVMSHQVGRPCAFGRQFVAFTVQLPAFGVTNDRFRTLPESRVSSHAVQKSVASYDRCPESRIR